MRSPCKAAVDVKAHYFSPLLSQIFLMAVNSLKMNTRNMYDTINIENGILTCSKAVHLNRAWACITTGVNSHTTCQACVSDAKCICKLLSQEQKNNSSRHMFCQFSDRMFGWNLADSSQGSRVVCVDAATSTLRDVV